MRIRPLRAADSEPLAELYLRDREFLRQWEPDEPDAFFTPRGQHESVAEALRESAAGRMLPWIMELDGRPVGRINLTNIALGHLMGASVGYWVPRAFGGRGYASSAVGQLLEIAFFELGLHRIDAYVRLDNAASRRVLDKHGFRAVGVSRGHLHAGGRWHDQVCLQKLAPWDDGERLGPGFDDAYLALTV
ncbi:GNAT family N-acetyltransferase [Streptomyces sp. NBC_00442]|uniref:GNAT family N-acetyltransferase n=1 Tax=Streptomyces sp. NBC_00442 TaxID=2903651 RepID=UPI002E1CBE31